MFNPNGLRTGIEMHGMGNQPVRDTAFGDTTIEREPDVVYDMAEWFRDSFGKTIEAARVLLLDGHAMEYSEEEVQERAHAFLQEFVRSIENPDAATRHERTSYGEMSEAGVREVVNAARDIIAQEVIDSADIDRLFALIPPPKNYTF